MPASAQVVAINVGPPRAAHQLSRSRTSKFKVSTLIHRELSGICECRSHSSNLLLQTHKHHTALGAGIRTVVHIGGSRYRLYAEV